MSSVNPLAKTQPPISAYPPAPEWEAAQQIPPPPKLPTSITDVRALLHVNRHQPQFFSFEDLGL